MSPPARSPAKRWTKGSPSGLVPAAIVAVSSAALGCGSGDGGTGGASSTSASTSASDSSTSSGSTTSTTTSASGSGGGGGSGYVPTLADIQFQAVNAVPSGPHILINDWNSAPNSVWAMTPDGATLVEVFRAYRVWSMGVSHAVDQIAFACGDTQQKLHYGTDVGDAIQHTFDYDIPTQTAKLLSNGNINDECHSFSYDDKTLFVCRRYDFDMNGNSKGYRIGTIDVATSAFTWLLPESATVDALYPQPVNDGLSMLYTQVPVPTGDRTIARRTLANGQETSLQQNSNAPVLSPSGTRYLYVDYGDAGSLHAADLDGANDVVVLGEPGASSYRYSPDGSHVVYLTFDNAASCSHVEVVASNGSEKTSPLRIYDCATKGRFITDLAWVNVP